MKREDMMSDRDAVAEAESILREALLAGRHANTCAQGKYLAARNVTYSLAYAHIRGSKRRAKFVADYCAATEADKPPCNCWKARARTFLAASALRG